MNQMHENVVERLNIKKQELSGRQEQFDILWQNEKHSKCFERNAINDLLIMQQLKSEISELEHWELLLRAQIKE